MYLAIRSSSLKPSSGQPLKYKKIRNIYSFRTKVDKLLNVRMGNGVFFLIYAREYHIHLT